MYAKLKTDIKQVPIEHIIILLIICIFMISGIISYFGSQNMYHEVIQQKIMRDKANRL